MSTDLTAMQDRINSILSQINAESIQVRLYALGLAAPLMTDDPYELDMPDATPTGIGDPLADVFRNIDELLEGQ